MVDTAADAVVSVPPPDDAGARTADLYDWQAAMAAADGLSIFLAALDDHGKVPRDAIARVLCEHHEDWVVRWVVAGAGARVEVLSADGPVPQG